MYVVTEGKVAIKIGERGFAESMLASLAERLRFLTSRIK